MRGERGQATDPVTCIQAQQVAAAQHLNAHQAMQSTVCAQPATMPALALMAIHSCMLYSGGLSIVNFLVGCKSGSPVLLPLPSAGLGHHQQGCPAECDAAHGTEAALGAARGAFRVPLRLADVKQVCAHGCLARMTALLKQMVTIFQCFSQGIGE